MLVRALCGFCIGGGIDVKPGDEFNAPDHMVRYWVSTGNVVPVDAAQPLPAGGLSVDRLYTQEGQVMHLDPAKARRT